MVLGIIAGVFSAIFQDLGYSFGRRYIKQNGNPKQLFIYTQISMGIISIPILIIALLNCKINSLNFIMPLTFTIIGANLGQYFFLKAEETIIPEKIASLMGLRLVSLAIVSSIFLGSKYDYIQWGAIFLASFSAFLMNYEDNNFKLKGFHIFLLSIICYTLSDLNVQKLVYSWDINSVFLGSLLSMSLVNIISGLTLALTNKIEWRFKEFVPILPYSSSWIMKQLGIYLTYSLIGAVHGNVVLSIRGPLALGIAYILVKLHMSNDSEKIQKSLWIQRIVASILMMLAIICYTLHSI